MRAFRWIAAAAVAAGAAWISVDLLHEAYGSGPPYYGLTVNMDKWASPWLTVLAVDALAIAIVIGLLAPWRRRPRVPTGKDEDVGVARNEAGQVR